MGGDTAARGEDALGGDHAAQILGRGLDADEQDFLALGGGRDGTLGIEIDLAGGGAGTGGKAGGDGLGLLESARSKIGREHLVELVGRDRAGWRSSSR